ncbi:MAG: glycine--tRNA ligase [bacterium]
MADLFESVVNLCKRRGFIYQSSEIYGGLAATWDYGHLGIELKRNVRDAWWQAMVREHEEIVGIETSILMHPEVWIASGHVNEFHDLMVDCKQCRGRFRVDHLPVKDGAPDFSKCPTCGTKDSFTEPRNFNLMFKTMSGAVEASAQELYLRPETAQGAFVDFKLTQTNARLKLPCGIAQIGKSFRNEVTTKSFIFRSREFEQMEMEYFVKPGSQKAWYDHWVQERFAWYQKIGIRPENLRLRPHADKELAHYAEGCTDVEYNYPNLGWGELEGIASRTDFDLKAHATHSGKDLSYFDAETSEKYLPYVVETAVGVDRTVLIALLDAFHEDEVEGEKRTVLRFSPQLAPVKAAILPLQKKDELMALSQGLFRKLQKYWNIEFDVSGNIGRRYRRQDEIGTPWCFTVDFDSINDQCVTVRDRDTLQQERIPIDSVAELLRSRLDITYASEVTA